jgi:hypothetical protein
MVANSGIFQSLSTKALPPSESTDMEKVAVEYALVQDDDAS